MGNSLFLALFGLLSLPAFADQPTHVTDFTGLSDPLFLAESPLPNCLVLGFSEEINAETISILTNAEALSLKEAADASPENLQDVSGYTVSNINVSKLKNLRTFCASKNWNSKIPFAITGSYKNTKHTAFSRFVNPTLPNLKFNSVAISSKKPTTSKIAIPLRFVGLTSTIGLFLAEADVESQLKTINQIYSTCEIEFYTSAAYNIDPNNIQSYPKLWPFIINQIASPETFALIKAFENQIGPDQSFTVFLGAPLFTEGPMTARGFAMGHPILVDMLKKDLGFDSSLKNYVFSAESVYTQEEFRLDRESLARTTAHEIGHLLIGPEHSPFESLMFNNHGAVPGGMQLTDKQCVEARRQASNFLSTGNTSSDYGVYAE